MNEKLTELDPTEEEMGFPSRLPKREEGLTSLRYRRRQRSGKRIWRLGWRDRRRTLFPLHRRTMFTHRGRRTTGVPTNFPVLKGKQGRWQWWGKRDTIDARNLPKSWARVQVWARLGEKWQQRTALKNRFKSQIVDVGRTTGRECLNHGTGNGKQNSSDLHCRSFKTTTTRIAGSESNSEIGYNSNSFPSLNSSYAHTEHKLGPVSLLKWAFLSKLGQTNRP